MLYFITKTIEFFLFILGLIPLKALSMLSWWSNFARKSSLFDLGAEVTKKNLKIAFPNQGEKEILSLANKSIKETIKTINEIGFVWSRLQREKLSKYIEDEGFINISKSLNKKKGVIMFAPHLSNIEILLHFVARKLPCTVLYTPSKNKYFDNVMLAARKRMGADMVKPNLAGVKSMLAKLKDGGVVLIASDQVPKPEGGLLSNFFSEPALTMTLVSKLKLKTEAPCHSVYCLRKPNGEGFKVMFSKEIKGMDLDMQSSVDCMNQELEKCIMNAPEQYAWEYKRYKHSEIKDLY